MENENVAVRATCAGSAEVTDFLELKSYKYTDRNLSLSENHKKIMNHFTLLYSVQHQYQTVCTVLNKVALLCNFLIYFFNLKLFVIFKKWKPNRGRPVTILCQIHLQIIFLDLTEPIAPLVEIQI